MGTAFRHIFFFLKNRQTCKFSKKLTGFKNQSTISLYIKTAVSNSNTIDEKSPRPPGWLRSSQRGKVFAGCAS